MKKKLLSLALALCMALALLPGAALAAESDFVIENGVLTSYTGSGGDVVIPDGVTCIDGWAFEGCTNLTSVDIPSSVTEIGNNAFEGCVSLSNVIIPSSITQFGRDAFYGCTNLTSVTIADGVTRIGERAFIFCDNLTSVTIPTSVTEIDVGAFLGCTSLTSLDIPSGITSIEDYTFRSCESLTSVVIPEGVTKIGEWAFEGCTGLTSVNIPSGVTSIEDFAFRSCKSLTSVIIPEGVTSIGEQAFRYCEDLTSVTIPQSVTSIGLWSFAECTHLTDVYYNGSEESWNAIEINNSEKGNDSLLNATIHYNNTELSTPAEPSAPTVGGFHDVHEGDYFADPVLWAVENGITTGTGNGAFSPDDTCIRGQVVTFLYRAMGSPSVSGSSSFTDVTNAGDYFYNAVLWAVKNQVTSGTTDTTFSPNDTCTRGQVVTFLWRSLGSSKVSGSGSSFTDVPSGEYYTDAVAWAVVNGITDGTSATTFSPNDICTRGQVVTFLYRALA